MILVDFHGDFLLTCSAVRDILCIAGYYRKEAYA